MPQKEVKKVLKEFGLTDNTIEIYLLLAKRGPLKGGEIAKQTKIDRSLVYRILKRLKRKGLLESTLESPTRFMVIPFEKALDLIIKTKQEEALAIEKAKNDLLEDWKTISEIGLSSESEKFVVIEGNKNIYPKISQMIKESKQKFYGILPVSNLVRAEQFGVFDAAHNHPRKSEINFWFITEVTKDELKAIKLFKPKLEREIHLKTRKLDSSYMTLPRMAMRDEKEILFFTRSTSEVSITKKNEICIYTNCESLVQTYKSIFQEMWEKSIDIEDKLAEIEFGIHPEQLSSDETKKSEKIVKILEREKVDSFRRISEEEKKKLSSYLSQIDLLDEQERDILDCASIIGQNFSLEIVQKVTGLSRIKLLKKLNKIQRQYDLVNSTNDKFEFNHPKIREILYNKIDPQLRKEYHSIIAQYLKELYKDSLDKIHDTLAYHYYNSENAKKGVPLLLKAGKHAWKEYDIFKTIEYYSQAVELMHKDEFWNEKKTSILEKLGDLDLILTRYETANAFYEKGIMSTTNSIIGERIRRKIRKKKIIEKDGIKIAYFVYGGGDRTVVFVGGPFYYMPQVIFLSQRYRVVVMDLSQTLIPSKSPTEHTFELYLKIFDSIIEDQDDSNICLVGAGLGGLLAIGYIARYPEKISKLALFATPLIRGTRNSILQKQVDYFWALAFQNPSWGIKKMHERMINTFAKKGKIEDYQLFPKSSPEISLIHSKIIMDTDVRPLLNKIRIPTLILEGEKTFRPKENIETMKKIPNSKVYIFKDAYLISLKEAEKFNRILEEFFIHGPISE